MFSMNSFYLFLIFAPNIIFSDNFICECQCCQGQDCSPVHIGIFSITVCDACQASCSFNFPQQCQIDNQHHEVSSVCTNTGEESFASKNKPPGERKAHIRRPIVMKTTSIQEDNAPLAIDNIPSSIQMEKLPIIQLRQALIHDKNHSQTNQDHGMNSLTDTSTSSKTTTTSTKASSTTSTSETTPYISSTTKIPRVETSSEKKIQGITHAVVITQTLPEIATTTIETVNPLPSDNQIAFDSVTETIHVKNTTTTTQPTVKIQSTTLCSGQKDASRTSTTRTTAKQGITMKPRSNSPTCVDTSRLYSLFFFCIILIFQTN